MLIALGTPSNSKSLDRLSTLSTGHLSTLTLLKISTKLTSNRRKVKLLFNFRKANGSIMGENQEIC